MLKVDFNIAMQRSYGFSQDEFNSSVDWRLIRVLYELFSLNGVQSIPKKIHQIWLGGKLPEEYRGWTKTWEAFHPSWEYKLWTDADVNKINITSIDYFNKCTNPAMKSDILRYEILRQIGGLYIDTDFECLKPFDDLLSLHFFTGIGYDRVLQLYNGLIASVPDHPIINDCVNIRGEYQGGRGVVALNTTGANFFTRCFINNISEGVVALPVEYFYPFPNNVRNEENPYKYVTENSYAIHHWAVSWTRRNLKKQRNVSK